MNTEASAQISSFDDAPYHRLSEPAIEPLPVFSNLSHSSGGAPPPEPPPEFELLQNAIPVPDDNVRRLLDGVIRPIHVLPQINVEPIVARLIDIEVPPPVDQVAVARLINVRLLQPQENEAAGRISELIITLFICCILSFGLGVHISRNLV